MSAKKRAPRTSRPKARLEPNIRKSGGGSLLDDYFDLREKVFAYFGYVEDWRRIPLDDSREYFWRLNGDGSGTVRSDVRFAETPELLDAPGEKYEIYTQRHLPKWVYRGPEFTMVCVDTRTDLNVGDAVLLRVFDNAKERP